MVKVLIVDNDPDNLDKIRKGFKDLHHFELITAVDGETALAVLNKNKVAVFVTAIDLPKLQGIDLIAFMTRKRPDTPCIAMVEPNTPKPWFQERTGHENVLYYLQKPFQFGNLASAIFVGQNLKDEGLSRKGITLRNFLPLIEISKKTCRLDITSGGQKQGFLYFDQGVLLNAHCEHLTGEPAAWEMVKWDRVSLNLSDLPKEKSKKIIKTELMEIAGALWGKPVKPTSRSRPAGAQNGRPSGSGISKLQASLNRYVNILRTVKGYTGVCILSPDGKILATHKLNESIDFNAFASAFNQMLSDARQTTFQKGFEKCRGLTLHTEKSLILMMAADVMKEGNFRFLVLMESNGNSYFMQVQLAKLIPGILAAR